MPSRYAPVMTEELIPTAEQVAGGLSAPATPSAEGAIEADEPPEATLIQEQEHEPESGREDRGDPLNRTERGSRRRSNAFHITYAPDIPLDCCGKIGRVQYAEVCGTKMCYVGPHYDMTFCPYCLTLTPIILFAVFIMPTLEWYLNTLTTILFLVAVLSLVGATCTDPGIIPKGSGEIENPPPV